MNNSLFTDVKRSVRNTETLMAKVLTKEWKRDKDKIAKAIKI